MKELTLRTRTLALVGLIGLGVTASACATVKPEELDTRLDQIREEMRRADQENTTRINEMGDRVGGLEGRMSTLDQDLEALDQDLEALGRDFSTMVERFETAIRFNTPVHFAYDRADIRPEDRQFLDRFATVVKQYYANATVTVEGFADPAGGETYNRGLGQRRAEAVKTYLVGRGGLATERVRTVTYGEAANRLIRPNAQGPGDAGIENRRVVLVVDYVPRPGASTAGTRVGGGS